MDKYILQFKAKASQADLGDTALIEYLKARLNPVLSALRSDLVRFFTPLSENCRLNW